MRGNIGLRINLVGIFAMLCVVSCNAESVRIGALAELSGPFQGIGEECRRGYLIAEQAFGSAGIEIVYGDHQRVARTGISEFHKLVERDHVEAVVTNAAPVALALNPVSKQRKIPLLATVVMPSFTGDNPYALRFWPTAESEGHAVADHLIRRRLLRLAILTLQDEYPVSVTTALKVTLPSLGGTVVFSEDVLAGSTDLSSVISKMKRANPDAVFINVVGEQIAVIMRRMREQGITQPFIGTFSLARPDILASAGHAAEHATFIEVDGDKPQFLRKLKEKFEVSHSTGLNYTCYAALSAALQSARRPSSDAIAPSFAARLTELQEVPLLDGPLRIINREAQFDFVAREVSHGLIQNWAVP